MVVVDARMMLQSCHRPYVSILQGSVKLIPSLRTVYPDFPKYNFSYHLHENMPIGTFDVSVRLLSAIAVSEVCTDVPHMSSYGKVTCMYVRTYVHTYVIMYVLCNTYMLTTSISLSCCLHLPRTLHAPPYGTTHLHSFTLLPLSFTLSFPMHASPSIIH